MASMMAAMMLVRAAAMMMVRMFAVPHAALHNGADNARAAIQSSGGQVYHPADDAYNAGIVWLGMRRRMAMRYRVAVVVVVIHGQSPLMMRCSDIVCSAACSGI